MSKHEEAIVKASQRVKDLYEEHAALTQELGERIAARSSIDTVFFAMRLRKCCKALHFAISDEFLARDAERDHLIRMSRLQDEKSWLKRLWILAW